MSESIAKENGGQNNDVSVSIVVSIPCTEFQYIGCPFFLFCLKKILYIDLQHSETKKKQTLVVHNTFSKK